MVINPEEDLNLDQKRDSTGPTLNPDFTSMNREASPSKEEDETNPREETDSNPPVKTPASTEAEVKYKETNQWKEESPPLKRNLMRSK